MVHFYNRITHYLLKWVLFVKYCLSVKKGKLMEKNLLKIISLFAIAIYIPFTSATLIENQDYTILENPVITQSNKANINDKNPAKQDKIEIVEFFSYGCPYCYKIESEISKWLAHKPDNVTFTRIAVPRKGKWVDYARLFYSLNAISPKEQERIMPLIYSAIHDQKIDLKTTDQLLNWVKHQNVNYPLLEEYFYSEKIAKQAENALDLAIRYNVKYVPSIYINGKYNLILDSKNNYKGTENKLDEFISMLNHK